MADQKDVDKAAPDQSEPEEDETRRKFREALELKQQRRHATSEAVVRDGSEKSHGATGPTKGRTFRRKSI
jgi:hypothetical protein